MNSSTKVLIHGSQKLLGMKKTTKNPAAASTAEDRRFGTNELIFTETKIFETKVVLRGMLYTIVTNDTKIKQKKTRKQKLWSQKKVQKKINMKNWINYQETQEIKIIKNIIT